MTTELRVDVSAGVAVLTLHRPSQQNAFTTDLAYALSAALRRCDEEDNVRAVVLTGTPPAFCAGVDLSARDHDRIVIAPPPWSIRKPVIAAVNGHAVGLGLSLALQCDMRFMAADAVYGLVQARRGVIPDGYAHWTLPRLVGMAHATDIILTGRTFDGEEAQSMGLANAGLSTEEVLPTALAVAQDLAASSAPLSVALSKRLLWESLGMTPAHVGRLERQLHQHLAALPDATEGVQAYLGLRPPQWTGSVNNDWPVWESDATKAD
jgi:enoyl-CoA hydratase/carnithine racemase